MHLYRNHTVNKKKNSVQIYCCIVNNCGFNTGEKNKISCHMYKHVTEGTNVTCPFSNCPKLKHVYKSVSSLKSHIYRNHNKKDRLSKNMLRDAGTVYASPAENEIAENVNVNNSEHNGISTKIVNGHSVYIKSLASTYLTLQAKFFLTDVALQSIVDGLSDINEITLQSTRAILEESNMEHMFDTFESNNFFKVAHDKVNGLLRSPYIRRKFYKNNFNYVAPVDIILGKRGSKDIIFSYIPILETVKVLLNNEHLLKQLTLNYCSAEPRIFADISDGDCYKNSEFYRNNPTALQIILYQDSFEVCNPLGSSRKVHKVVGVYFTLGNIPPYCRSKVDQIQLVAVCSESSVKTFGFHKIFEVILRDVKLLETEGIEVRSNEFIKGTIIAVTGDNLGSHQLGGFSENFSTNKHICRYCLANTTDISKDCKKKFALRTVHSYEHDAIVAEMTGEITNGVKCNSVLNKCDFFHVCGPGLPPCLAHDVYEGIVSYDLVLIINRLVSHKYFTLEQLNDKLQKIRFEYEFRYEKVPLLSKKAERLSGSATENLRLLIILPFATLDFVDDDPCWKLIKLLNDISALILSVKLSLNQLAYLKYLIEEYMELRVQMFPNDKLRPKHHYLTHYPYLIRKFGPLKHLWTLRYESKHRYFKSVLKHSPNFKNVLRTLSERHQLLQAMHATQGTLFLSKVIADEAVVCTARECEESFYNYISQFCTFEGKKFVATNVSFRGTIYKTGMMVCSDKIDDDLYVMCKVKFIIINSTYDNLYFYGSKIKLKFNDELHLFESVAAACNTDNFGVHYNSLLTYEPALHFVTPQHRALFLFKAAPYDVM